MSISFLDWLSLETCRNKLTFLLGQTYVVIFNLSFNKNAIHIQLSFRGDWCFVDSFDQMLINRD